MSQGDFAGAIADCDQAVRITPRLAESYLNRAAARTMVGDDLVVSRCVNSVGTRFTGEN